MKLYGLLGKTLKHSFSKAYFTIKFAQQGISDCAYENFELTSIEELPDLLARHSSLHGLNVTIPYKESVLSFLDYQDEIVRDIQAANCIKISQGKLHGFNTDVIGFQQSIEKFLKPQHTRALVLGTGGAAKAVNYALARLGISFTEVSRSKANGKHSYDDLDKDLMHQHTIIINTTPAGMYPHMDQAPPIPYDDLTSEHLLFDLIYNPEETLFLKKGKAQGATTVNGAEMLVLQAEESWRIWNS